MQLDDGAMDRILTIIQLLAQGADDKRLSHNRVHALNQNVEALIQDDSDQFVREFLARVRRPRCAHPECEREANRISVAASARVSGDASEAAQSALAAEKVTQRSSKKLRYVLGPSNAVIAVNEALDSPAFSHSVAICW